MKESERVLGRARERITSQRALLLDLIRKNQHADAFELYERARKKLPKISLSTVYRSLQLFKRIGLVDEYHFAEEHHHYEVKPGAEHYHLVCNACGRIVEFDHALLDHLKGEIEAAHGFSVKSTDLQMNGLCRECSARESKG